jgi:hypothetical protein
MGDLEGWFGRYFPPLVPERYSSGGVHTRSLYGGGAR